MCCTCFYALRMSKMVQVRNVPEALHRKLKSRAALAGLPISDFLLREIERVVERPTQMEILERLRALPSVEVDNVAAIREERDR